MESLDQIVTDSEVVFLDTSLIDSSYYNLRDFTSFQALNPKKLELKERDMAHFLELLKNPFTKTIPEVTAEIGSYAYRLKNDMTRMVRTKDKGKSLYQNNQAILKRILEKTHQCKTVSQQKEFNPDDNDRYRILIDMVKIVVTELGLKERHRSQYKRAKQSSDTDERLVAAMYHTSLARRTPILLTRDTHFPTILGVTPTILGSDVFLPHNRSFRQALVFNPFRLYLYFDRKFKVEFNHKHFKVYPSEFIAFRNSPEKSIELRTRLADYWKRFSPMCSMHPAYN